MGPWGRDKVNAIAGKRLVMGPIKLEKICVLENSVGDQQ